MEAGIGGASGTSKTSPADAKGMQKPMKILN